jgi:acetyl esterase/lipase
MWNDSVPAAKQTGKRDARQIPNRLLIHLHGGYYVFFPGEVATYEAILMAGYAHMKVISVDYRQPPDFPYPAGLNDAVAVWKEVAKTGNPANMAIFGTSAGGGMTLAVVHRAKQGNLPMPVAIAPGTPAADMTKTSDTYCTNDMVDNVLVSYGPFGEAAYKLYANGHDLKDPMHPRTVRSQSHTNCNGFVLHQGKRTGRLGGGARQAPLAESVCHSGPTVLAPVFSRRASFPMGHNRMVR